MTSTAHRPTSPSPVISCTIIAMMVWLAVFWPKADYAKVAPSSLELLQGPSTSREEVFPDDVPSLSLLIAPPPRTVPVQLEPIHQGVTRQQVARYINRTFRINLKEARQITDWAVEIGEARDLDPLLILAVIGTESSFKPTARSGVGAEGLMQVMTKVHEAKFDAFGGPEAAFDPYANIVVGTDILTSLIRRTGSVRKALKWYSGAANLPDDRGYAARVMREHGLLNIAAEGKIDVAVKLHRAGEKAENTAAAGAKHLSFTRWTDLSDAEKKHGTVLVESRPVR